MNLFKAYDAAIVSGKISDDPLQREVLAHFQRLFDELHKPTRAWIHWIKKPLVKGIYLYGSVGAGKTFLMDLFYQHLHGRGKVRYHFHHFMQYIDGQLRRLQGKKNPLKIIAANFAKTTQILCLDEMIVNDVAHAMILAELFHALFKEGIVLITTSNTAPDDLYRNGVQRTRFLPAITAIHQNCVILALHGKKDFRLNHEPAFQAYLYPLTKENNAILDRQFSQLGGLIQEFGEINIQNRTIPYLKRTEKAIWFDFNVICNLPRSQLDYLEIVAHFSTIVVSHMPELVQVDSANSILFVNFIDVLYDNHIRLMLSAAVSLEQLFSDNRDAFKRTYSRLQEMQSMDYSLRY